MVLDKNQGKQETMHLEQVNRYLQKFCFAWCFWVLKKESGVARSREGGVLHMANVPVKICAPPNTTLFVRKVTA